MERTDERLCRPCIRRDNERAPPSIVRLGFRAATGSASIEERGATFLMLGGRLSVCPFSFELANHLELAPCTGINLGQLTGHGVGSAALPEPRDAAIFWASAQGELSLRWSAAKPLVVHGGAELGFPLVRHTFIFEGPTRLIYDVPVVGVGASVGVSVRFH